MAKGSSNNSGCGGVKILDAIIKEYEIEAGASINAGDLVDFVNNKAIPCDYNSFDNGTTQALIGLPSTAYMTTATRVSETGVILCYGNPSMTYPYAIGLNIVDGVITKGANPLVLNYTNLTALSPGYKVVENVGAVSFTLSSGYTQFMILKLEDDLSITITGNHGAVHVTTTVQCGMIKPISSTRAVIVHTNFSPCNQLTIRYFSIDETDFSLTQIDYKIYTAPNVAYGYTALETIDGVNFICFTHETNSRRMNFFTFSIEDELINSPTFFIHTTTYLEPTYGIALVKQNNFIGVVAGGWNQDLNAYTLVVDCGEETYPYAKHVISTIQLVGISSVMFNNSNIIFYKFDSSWTSSILSIISLYNVQLLQQHKLKDYTSGTQIGGVYLNDMGFMFHKSTAYQFFTYKGAKGIAKESGIEGETKNLYHGKEGINMFIIIETKTEKYLDSCGEYQQKENGYIVNDCVYSLNWAEMKEIEEIPTEVKPQKYCYNATDGFYLNPNYVEPIDPNQELIDLKAKVTQQDEIIVQLLIDSLMGGA